MEKNILKFTNEAFRILSKIKEDYKVSSDENKKILYYIFDGLNSIYNEIIFNLPLNDKEEELIISKYKKLISDINKNYIIKNTIVSKYYFVLTDLLHKYNEYNKSNKIEKKETSNIKNNTDSLVTQDNKVKRKFIEDNDDYDVKQIYLLTNQIHDLKRKNNSNNLSEAQIKQNNIKISNLRQERENIIINTLGIDYYENVKNIDSEEDMTFSQYDYFSNTELLESMDEVLIKEKTSKVKLNLSQFRKLMDNILHSYGILTDKKDDDPISCTKLDIIKNELHNCRDSLLKIVDDPKSRFDIENNYIILENLFSVYNFIGGYDKFSKNNQGIKINGKIVSKEIYDQQIDELGNVLTRIKNKADEYITKNGGYLIVENHIDSEEEKLKEVNNQLEKICTEIINKKSKVM